MHKTICLISLLAVVVLCHAEDQSESDRATVSGASSDLLKPTSENTKRIQEAVKRLTVPGMQPSDADSVVMLVDVVLDLYRTTYFDKLRLEAEIEQDKKSHEEALKVLKKRIDGLNEEVKGRQDEIKKILQEQAASK